MTADAAAAAYAQELQAAGYKTLSLCSLSSQVAGGKLHNLVRGTQLSRGSRGLERTLDTKKLVSKFNGAAMRRSAGSAGGATAGKVSSAALKRDTSKLRWTCRTPRTQC